MKITIFYKFLHKFRETLDNNIIWIGLVLVFILDIITTTIALNIGNGLHESNPYMVMIAPNVYLHILVKLIAFSLVFGLVEGAKILINKMVMIDNLQNLVIVAIQVGLVGMVLYFTNIILHNTILIFQHL
ncbi:hypothetical protein [Methanogenium cariaci]|uniref:hypothetical protein n=1 Tax=Methanogenium cariaci TaxID=2197 RepID=UPI000781AE9A|nr:hypothetical protein [Methanogenium cariaci]